MWDATILQYIDIFTTAIQYNTPDSNILHIADTLQYIATFIAFKVELLHYKIDWTRPTVTRNMQHNF